MFWDGERWVPEKGPHSRSKRPSSRNWLRRWLATLPILLLVPALLVPFFATQAAGPVLTLSPKAAPAGTSIKVAGSDFPRGASGSLTWDDGTNLGTFKVRGNGQIQVTYKKMPLYTYAGDSAPGQANGQGVGGTWFVLPTSGGSSGSTGGSGTSATTTTTAAHGY